MRRDAYTVLELTPEDPLAGPFSEKVYKVQLPNALILRLAGLIELHARAEDKELGVGRR